MNTHPFLFMPRAAGRLLAAGALTALLAACASVDLGQRYDPPPVRMPGEQAYYEIGRASCRERV